MERRVNYGYVERTHGLRGRLVLKLFVLGPAVPLEEGTLLYLEDRTLTVTRSRKKDNERITVDCEGIHTREQADELRGKGITIDESAALREGYPLPVHGFSGFTVISGEHRYPVEEVLYSSTNPQLMVRGENGVFPVPLNMALTGEVDPEQRTMTVLLPEGLEEL